MKTKLLMAFFSRSPAKEMHKKQLSLCQYEKQENILRVCEVDIWDSWEKNILSFFERKDVILEFYNNVKSKLEYKS